MGMAMQKNAMNRQKGMTLIGWIFVFVFFGFQLVIAINVAPVYFTDASVKSLWQGLETDGELIGMGKKRLRKIVIKRLKINNIYNVKQDDIQIKKTKGYYIVSLEYEPRGTIIGSLDYIVTFKHEAKIRTN